MQVNLDQTEFYYGPSPRQPRSTLPSTSERRPALVYAPQSFQHSFFHTETAFIQDAPASMNTADSSASLGHEWSSTGITKPCNAFDVAISDFYGGASSRPQLITD
ncbi:uncharacterized protein BDW43DRAFT_119903 [Aspergillus alliaceus]|uniref:uncharacterized protein n=1 Tax=Petromyces alliaceus TaxID=209559 RepID=UPI0012A6F11C|nr:uncharacterized protein BDW43DRAFT_119903 [Aspergillus alliaceus]KAB8238595.1 hypothetical protein BDW43DRAFT_119903 [Aspergillus alliaceus]